MVGAINGWAVRGVAGGIIYIATGSYNVAADSGHGVIDEIARYTRERSIEARAAKVKVPDLGSAPQGAERRRKAGSDKPSAEKVVKVTRSQTGRNSGRGHIKTW